MNARTPQQVNARVLQLLDLRKRIDSELALLASLPAPRKPTRGEPSCGTESGYYHHRRITETEPCRACKAAHTAADRARYARRKARERKAP